MHFAPRASARVGTLPTDDEAAARIAAARAVAIEALVAAGPASVRLRNAIERGVREQTMPCVTVGDYVDAGPAARALFMRDLWAFGKGTANELEALVSQFVEARAVGEPCDLEPEQFAPERSADESDRFDMLIDRLAELTFAQALHGQMPSTRLSNAMTQGMLMRQPAASLLTGGAAIRAEFMRKPNFGRKSLLELESLVQAAVVRLLARECNDPVLLLDDCALLFGTPEGERRALADRILGVLRSLPPREVGLVELLDWAMPELEARERAVLIRRYGMENGQIETLEEISETYSVTRERIRQVEAKAIRKLASKLKGTHFVQLIEQASERFWQQRAVPYIAFAARDSSQIRRELPPILTLALDIAKMNLSDWLARTSTAMRHGFLSRACDAETVVALGTRLRDDVAERCLPLALADVDGGVDPALAAAAICLETDLTLFEGYLFEDRPRPRLRRAVRLHRILASSRRSMSLYDLGEAYRIHRDEDDCSLRDLAIVMEDAPHLFIEVEEGLWIAVGQGAGASQQALGAGPAQAAEPVDPATIAGCLQQALLERGPTLVGDLYRDGASILMPGRARSSIAWVLVGRPDLFLRVLPGVYALPEQLLDEDSMRQVALPFLLTEAQARAYAFARKAGEAWGTYPFWTPAAEYRLCAWARFEAPEPLFHSLLSVASIDAWPIDAIQREQWTSLARLKGRFEIVVTGREPAVESRPELDRLLAACRIATERGALNWLLVNRMIGRRLDAAGGQGLLALMVALGCVTTPAGPVGDERLLAHPVTPHAAQIAHMLEAELLRCGTLDWDSPLGEQLAAEALRATGGWASRERLAALLGDRPLGEALADPDGDEDDDDIIARLMREHRRESENARREALAAGLLDE